MVAGEALEQRQASERLRAQLAESQQREKVLVRRLAAKEQETQDLAVSSSLPHWPRTLALWLSCS